MADAPELKARPSSKNGPSAALRVRSQAFMGVPSCYRQAPRVVATNNPSCASCSEMAELDKQLRALLRANPLNAADANALRGRCVRLPGL